MFPDMETVPCPSFEAAFDLVKDGEAGMAMIPIENSIAGRVADIHVLLPGPVRRWTMSRIPPRR
jgi:prephenate dehydratase